MGQTRKGSGKRQRIRALQRKRGPIDTKYYASCDGKRRWDKSQREIALSQYPDGAVKFYKCQYGPHYHVGRARKGEKWHKKQL